MPLILALSTTVRWKSGYSSDESPARICDEIMALTKMNWNNTQFDRKLPNTIECARNVGSILNISMKTTKCN